MRPISIILLICFSIQYLFLPCLPLIAQTQSQTKINVIVWEFDASGVRENEAKILSDRLRSELVKFDRFNVVDREKIEPALNELQFQQSGYIRTEDQIKIGQHLGARLIITGSVGKIGRTYTIDVSAIDIKTTKLLFTSKKDHTGSIDGLLPFMRDIAYELASGGKEPDKKKGSKKTLYILGAVVIGGVAYFTASSGKNSKSTKGSVSITIPGDI